GVFGVQDLTDGIIRIVGEPEQRIIRDPVRMLRAIRHAARNGFKIEAKTLEAISNHADKLDLCPTSRIRDELLKDLRGGTSKAWAELALQTGIFSTLFPFYNELFNDVTKSEAVQGEVLAMLGALDKIYCQGKGKGRVVLEDSMLFALLLFPWALRHFNLLNQELKGPVYHLLSRSIRSELDKVFAHRLNLKRAIKDKITTLFVNMSALQKNRKNDTWPAWLRKKSYFPDCSRFYALYQEAIAGETLTDLNQFIEEVPEDVAGIQEKPVIPAVTNTLETLRRGGRRGGNNPAFNSEKHGVFGLRKG
ncbi:MAG: CCA tRNA nucleotidyltransferase, partial [Candidatus Electrothrix sp. GM3_4]|nr:CCA tRNA nucleotidyltransferase [Candidatus Electrothrix sp. GM3_4]